VGNGLLSGPGAWGAGWERQREYATLDAVRAELNFETGRMVESMPIASLHARDFRLASDNPALKEGCYPRGEVPGTQLGAIEP
jgi:hypothetical protein